VLKNLFKNNLINHQKTNSNQYQISKQSLIVLVYYFNSRHVNSNETTSIPQTQLKYSTPQTIYPQQNPGRCRGFAHKDLDINFNYFEIITNFFIFI